MILRLIKKHSWLSAGILLTVVACSGTDDQNKESPSGSGGTPGNNTGGVSASGGLAGTGGATGGTDPGSTGGTVIGGGTGGAMMTGGSPGSGGAPETGGAPGAGGDLPVDTYTLSEAGGPYIYSVGDMSMTIDPADGGRVTSFIVAQQETLVQPGPAAEDGSVFWPSPQTLFENGWPPPPEIDSGAYTAAVSGDELTLTSANSAALGLTVTKVFTPTRTIGNRPAISITYTMSNTGVAAFDVAGWEISRVANGGMAFFPTGPAGQITSQDGLVATESGGHSWYEYDASGLNDMDVPKIFADGADGWLAWSTGTSVVIKSFEDVAQANFAPAESEIEIYADPSGDYCEVEQQGPLQTVAPGASATWTVLWIGVAIPDGSDTALGSTDLVQLVSLSL